VVITAELLNLGTFKNGDESQQYFKGWWKVGEFEGLDM
jgi:hypothetical protein